MEPPPPEAQQLFGAIWGNQRAMDGFVQMNAGTISPAQFFSPENVGAIMAAAGPGAPCRSLAGSPVVLKNQPGRMGRLIAANTTNW
jgi:hypothetical protein